MSMKDIDPMKLSCVISRGARTWEADEGSGNKGFNWETEKDRVQNK